VAIQEFPRLAAEGYSNAQTMIRDPSLASKLLNTRACTVLLLRVIALFGWHLLLA